MKEGDLILGTVKNVTNTITFVTLPNGKEGTLISSEIAPGRIKQMRQYVVPNKKIVCKILEISGDHIHLSLRRVTSKERQEVMKQYKQEQATEVAFKQILEKDVEEIRENILKDYENLTIFIDEAKEDKELISKYIPKEKEEQIRKLTNKKRKTAELKQNIKLKCLEDDGIKRIKKILEIDDEKVRITSPSAGNFKLKLTVEEFKQGKKKMAEILEELEKRAKENNCEFSSSEEK